MNLFKTIRATGIAVVISALGMGAGQAATVVLADGTLAESSKAPQGVGVTQALGAEFNPTNGPMTFTGTMSRESDQVSLGGGRYHLGMTIGNVYALLHPGFPGGAFRLNAVDPAKSKLLNAHVNNQNIGYTNDFSDVTFEIVLTAIGSDYSIDVSIDQASGGSSMKSYTLAQNLFGAGGSISSFGVMHNGLGTGYGSLDYSNFTATAAAVPLPAALPMLLVALGGMGVVSRRRKAS